MSVMVMVVVGSDKTTPPSSVARDSMNCSSDSTELSSFMVTEMLKFELMDLLMSTAS